MLFPLFYVPIVIKLKKYYNKIHIRDVLLSPPERIFWQKGAFALKKVIKWFSIFAVIGTAIGLAVAYFCKNSSDESEENETDYTEDEDFDLDADLQPAERGYVSLKKENGEQAGEQPDGDGEKKEEPKEEKEQSTDNK